MDGQLQTSEKQCSRCGSPIPISSPAYWDEGELVCEKCTRTGKLVLRDIIALLLQFGQLLVGTPRKGAVLRIDMRSNRHATLEMCQRLYGGTVWPVYRPGNWRWQTESLKGLKAIAQDVRIVAPKLSQLLDIYVDIEDKKERIRYVLAFREKYGNSIYLSSFVSSRAKIGSSG